MNPYPSTHRTRDRLARWAALLCAPLAIAACGGGPARTGIGTTTPDASATTLSVTPPPTIGAPKDAGPTGQGAVTAAPSPSPAPVTDACTLAMATSIATLWGDMRAGAYAPVGSTDTSRACQLSPVDQSVLVSLGVELSDPATHAATKTGDVSIFGKEWAIVPLDGIGDDAWWLGRPPSDGTELTRARNGAIGVLVEDRAVLFTWAGVTDYDLAQIARELAAGLGRTPG